MLTRLLKISGGTIVVGMALYPFVKPPKEGTFAERAKAEEAAKQQAVIESNTAQKQARVLPDFAAIYDVKQKKQAFFDYLTPYVVQINKDIQASRDFIKSLDAFPDDAAQAKRLNQLTKRFKVKSKQSFAELKLALLDRVDQIPLELVLMQAANESAWGTSRFALQANNLFGQWCFKPGCGVVPEGRPEGETYEVKKFSHPVDSIRSYFLNINTNYAYKDLRIVRRALRNMNEVLDPMILAEGLLAYSTRREAYVDELQRMISVNAKYIAK